MTYGALASSELLAQSRFEEARTRASQEIASMPNEPEAYFNRGQALAGLGRFAEAVDDYARALLLDASASALDPDAVDDEMFFAVRNLAVSRKADPANAVATLERYRRLLPAGRHVPDLQTWIDHIHGVEVVWVRETA